MRLYRMKRIRFTLILSYVAYVLLPSGENLFQLKIISHITRYAGQNKFNAVELLLRFAIQILYNIAPRRSIFSNLYNIFSTF